MSRADNLIVGKGPEEVLIYGKPMLFVDEYLWFEPACGIVTVYQVKEKDVKDHFNIFRGVDMLEACGQAGISACTVLECQKAGKSRDELKKIFRFVFLGVDRSRFFDYAKEGDVLIAIGNITSYRFRQMTLDSTLYKVAPNFDYQNYFQNYSIADFNDKVVPTAFTPMATFENMVGRAIKLQKLKMIDT
ncbi:MAG: hypothetical protein AAF798_01330 [Bacteroidota bacterium]